MHCMKINKDSNYSSIQKLILTGKNLGSLVRTDSGLRLKGAVLGGQLRWKVLMKNCKQLTLSSVLKQRLVCGQQTV